MASQGLAKAQIINLEDNSSVECMFNPEEYRVEKSNDWKRGSSMGKNMPKLQFSAGHPAEMQMRLLFDTYTAAKKPDQAKDVRKQYTDGIWKMMLVSTSLKDQKSGKSRPPRVRFQWGKAWTFDAVITHISQRFTMFTHDGTPVRAELDVTFRQIKDSALFPRQNPTSGGVGGERVWTVRDGDTLQWIAHCEYGNATQWRPIAEANGLTKVRELAPGTVLEIPNA